MGVLLNGSSWIQSTVAYNRPSTDHTVSYWLRLDNNSAVRRPFGHTGAWEARTSSGSNNLTSDYLQSGTLNVVPLTLGTFNHVCFVQDVTNGIRLGYVDGVLQSTVNPASFAGGQNANLSLGVTAGGSGQGWFGAIDDVRVYDRVLSAEEIQTIYACRGTDGIFDSLSLWYQLNEGSEGAAVTGPLQSIGQAGAGAPDLVTVTGSPVYNYDAGIKYRRRAQGL